MSSRQAGGRTRRTWPQRLLISFNIVVIVAALTTAAGLGYLQSKLGELQRVALGDVLTETDGGSGEPQNYLLVGTDDAAGLEPGDPILNDRDITEPLADTIMVLHLDPTADRAALLSLPRDLWLPLESANGEDLGNNRINAAMSFGGPPALIETIESSLGIPINHYVEVGFVGFREMVEALDGIPYYFDTPVRSQQAGLFVPDAGCVTLGPDQALAYARARIDYETFEDGEWQRDFSSDFGRVNRQQDFIRRALEQAVSSGVRNPSKLNQLIDVGLDSVVVDDQLSARDIFELGRRFRAFNPETLDLYTVPVVDETVGEAQVLQLVEDEAQLVFDIFRDQDPVELDPSLIRVEVLNGTGVPGQAGDATQQLAAVGFPTATPGDAGGTLDATTIRYTADQQPAAALVAQYVVGGAVLEEVDTTGVADVVVVTGANFSGVDAQPSAPAEVPPPAEAPVEEQAGAPSSTTVVGEVPGEPPPEVECS